MHCLILLLLVLMNAIGTWLHVGCTERRDREADESSMSAHALSVCYYLSTLLWFCCAWQVSGLNSENEDLRKKQRYMTAIDEENDELVRKIDVSGKEILRDI